MTMNEKDKQAEPVARCAWSNEFNGPILCNEGDEDSFDGRLYRHPAPAVAQEAVGLRELFERLLFCTYAGKDSYYNEEQIKHGCFERAQELADAAKRMNIALYTEAPAVAVNEQLLIVTKSLVAAMRKYELDVDDLPTREHRQMVDDAESAIAAAEKSTGGG